MAIPHNSKCRYGERGAADAKPKAQIMLDATKVSAASGGNSEPKHNAGTANFLDPKACTRITAEIGECMDAHGVKTLDEIRGCARG